MADLGRYLRLMGLMMKNCLIREMQFKANFLVRLFTEFMWLFMQFIYIEVMYGQTNSIVGWTKWDMIVLVGTNYAIAQLFEAFFYDNCMRLIDQIRQGDLDFNLIKPINTQFLVSLRYTDYSSILNSTVGIGVVLYGLNKMGAAVTWSGALLFGALLLNGILIYYAILFILSTWTFWIGRSNNLMELYWQFGQFSRYPGDIYPLLLKGALLTVMPMLVVSNFPAQVFVHGLQSGWALYAFSLGAVFFGLTVWIWKKGLQRYRSASS
ncbi:MAG TPA: ABC-2 family transporter protein [bacterium]|nr:ABC-2 family transporter protein [bacterium]